MKKYAAFVLIGIGLLALAYLGLMHFRMKAIQARRESSYQQTLATFQRDLHSGMARPEIEKYLESRNIQYSLAGGDAGDVWSYHVLIGQEPGDWLVCDRWNVYLALELSPSTKGVIESLPLPDDTLREVKIKKVGHCL